jgi:hypothetical protein
MGKHEGHSHASKKPIERVDHRPMREGKGKTADAYHAEQKSSDTMVCKQCGVISFAGKWSWKGPPKADVHEGLCPACQRIRDHYPAGYLELHGLHANEKEEIRHLLHNVEMTEKAEHPLERLMNVSEEGEVVIVTTTGMHLGRAIAGALGRRFRDRVSIDYPREDNRIRVILQR